MVLQGASDIDDGVELGEVRVVVQMDDGGEGLETGCLDFHQPLHVHFKNLNQLFQQAGIKEGLDVVCKLVGVDEHGERLKAGLDAI